MCATHRRVKWQDASFPCCLPRVLGNLCRGLMYYEAINATGDDKWVTHICFTNETVLAILLTPVLSNLKSMNVSIGEFLCNVFVN